MVLASMTRIVPLSKEGSIAIKRNAVLTSGQSTIESYDIMKKSCGVHATTSRLWKATGRRSDERPIPTGEMLDSGQHRSSFDTVRSASAGSIIFAARGRRTFSEMRTIGSPLLDKVTHLQDRHHSETRLVLALQHELTPRGEESRQLVFTWDMSHDSPGATEEGAHSSTKPGCRGIA